MQPEAAGEMDIEDIESSSAPGVGKERALGHGPEPGGAEGPRQGPA